MKTSAAGIAKIRGYEGARNEAYADSRGIPTIGVGHTGPEVHLGLKWTTVQVDAQLAMDLTHFEQVVSVAVKVPLTQGQFDALVSLAFNIGAVAFAASTLVKRLNANDMAGVPWAWTAWKKAGSAPDALLGRRSSELWDFARATP